MTAPQLSLFDRIGGDSVIPQLVERLYLRVLQDSQLEPFFRESSLPRVLAMQREFIAAALDRPVKYSGQDLARIHDGRGIRREHLARFLAHLTEALTTFPEIDARYTAEIVSRIATYSDQIVGDSGGDDG
ncbi:MAG: group 1 truncated hemoglobin [Planctomyces sp.]|nr:group 1 truncated hemoglobin [Planctomyces sp.]